MKTKIRTQVLRVLSVVLCIFLSFGLVYVQPASAQQATSTLSTFRLIGNISTQLPGAPSFEVRLVVNPGREIARGFGEITQAVNPPVAIKTKLRGSQKELGNNLFALDLDGYDESGEPNTNLHIIYSRESKSGEALYTYNGVIVTAPFTDTEE